jgi:hypothetical protein
MTWYKQLCFSNKVSCYCVTDIETPNGYVENITIWFKLNILWTSSTTKDGVELRLLCESQCNIGQTLDWNCTEHHMQSWVYS